MRLLVISPDYASHALPMIQVASAWTRLRGEAIVATGDSTRPMVEQAGLAWTSLRLGKGSNPGVIEESQQPAGEDEHLRAFFDATRAGPVATLLYQADARRHDLLHQPDRVLDRLRMELAGAGKEAHFETLKAALPGDMNQASYEHAAASLGITVAAATQAAYRMRKRYRELFRQEVARTVDKDAEVDDEIARLLETLSE